MKSTCFQLATPYIRGFALLILHTDLCAQTVPANKTTGSRTDGQEAKHTGSAHVLELSPFVVEAVEDESWFARNSLAGSRLNAPVRDIAASIDVITADLISDLAATDMTEISRYTANSTDETTESVNTTGLNISSGTLSTRGQGVTLGRDFFVWPNILDFYNVERADLGRGPNGILFGSSSAGGLKNSTTKTAKTNRNSGTIQYDIGNNEFTRGVVDYNKVLLQDKLAVRVNLLKQLANTAMEYEQNDRKGLALAATWRPKSTTVIKLGFENLSSFDSIASRRLPRDAYSFWMDKGKNLTNKRPPTSLTSNANPFNNQDRDNFGIVGTGATQQWTVVTNANLPVINRRLSGVSKDYDTVNASPLLGPISGGRVADIPGLAGVNMLGPSNSRNFKVMGYQANLEQRLAKNLYFNAAYDQFYSDWGAHRTFVPTIQADPNALLPDGTPNPFAGQPYMQLAWHRDIAMRNGERWRSSLAYGFDWGNLFGRHQIAASYEGSSELLVANRLLENYTVDGKLFNPDPVNSNNQLAYRTYVDLNVPSSISFGPRSFDPVSWTYNGATYQTYWASVPNAGGLNDQTSRGRAFMIADQAYFLNNKLAITAGFRSERLNLINRSGYVRSPDGLSYVRPDPSLYGELEVTYRTTTIGAVYHVLPSLSIFANRSNNNGDPTQAQIQLYPDGRAAPPPQNEGTDLGLMVSLLDNRLTIRLARYESNSVGEHNLSGPNPFATPNNNILNALLDPAGNGDPSLGGSATSGTDRLITPDEYKARTFISTGYTYDRDASGVELQVLGQPVKGWNVRFSFAQNKRENSNVAQDIVEWFRSSEPFWAKFDQNLIVTAGTPLATAVDNLQATINTTVARYENTTGFRPYNTNLLNSYTFQTGWLKRVTIGNGLRYQSKNVLGQTADGKNIYGNILMDVDVFLKFTQKGPWGTRLTYQLNGTSVNRRDFKLVPTVLNSSGNAYSQNTVLYPATWKASVRVDF